MVESRTGAPQGRGVREQGGEQVDPQHDSHGQSTAAWVTVGVLMVAALVMSIAVVISNRWVFVAGAVLAVIGLIVGRTLSAMGFGASGHPGH